MGETTKTLHEFKPGERIGIRGPYGTNFETEGKRILVVAGGIGIAPLAPFIDKAKNEDKKVVLAFGAKTSSELLFIERLKNYCEKINLATDDGSRGYHGFVSDLAEEILEKENFDAVLTCGPEIMMKKVVDISRSRNLPVQVSLERYMKCGVGLCDSCAINGLHVCLDGPVFEGEKLLKLNDFGKLRRDASGRVERI
jgi:dihydroorotate dehydrogenase electron transfer subunit